MARTAIAAGAWTSIQTTTVDTLFTPEGGNVRMFTGSTSGIDFDNGAIVNDGIGVIVPSGLEVSFYAARAGIEVVDIIFGV